MKSIKILCVCLSMLLVSGIAFADIGTWAVDEFGEATTETANDVATDGKISVGDPEEEQDGVLSGVGTFQGGYQFPFIFNGVYIPAVYLDAKDGNGETAILNSIGSSQWFWCNQQDPVTGEPNFAVPMILMDDDTTEEWDPTLSVANRMVFGSTNLSEGTEFSFANISGSIQVDGTHNMDISATNNLNMSAGTGDVNIANDVIVSGDTITFGDPENIVDGIAGGIGVLATGWQFPLYFGNPPIWAPAVALSATGPTGEDTYLNLVGSAHWFWCKRLNPETEEIEQNIPMAIYDNPRTEEWDPLVIVAEHMAIGHQDDVSGEITAGEIVVDPLQMKIQSETNMNLIADGDICIGNCQ